MARPGSPGPLRRHGRPREFGSASPTELFVCLGNESPPHRRRNPIIGNTLAGALRPARPERREGGRMKKTILTIVQLLVTGALLYWVFHNPAVRTAMAVAIR